MIPAAYAVLNLDAVQHNEQMVRRYAPDAKIMAVIKANGYGHVCCVWPKPCKMSCLCGG